MVIINITFKTNKQKHLKQHLALKVFRCNTLLLDSECCKFWPGWLHYKWAAFPRNPFIGVVPWWWHCVRRCRNIHNNDIISITESIAGYAKNPNVQLRQGTKVHKDPPSRQNHHTPGVPRRMCVLIHSTRMEWTLSMYHILCVNGNKIQAVALDGTKIEEHSVY